MLNEEWKGAVNSALTSTSIGITVAENGSLLLEALRAARD